MINWDMFTNFSEDEFCCRCGCGKANMNHEFLVKLQVIRSNIGLPMTITSGYRCEEHDKNIGGAGPHTTGRAVDISIMGQSAYLLLRYAIDTWTLLRIWETETVQGWLGCRRKKRTRLDITEHEARANTTARIKELEDRVRQYTRNENK
jgi:hypothetical protein